MCNCTQAKLTEDSADGQTMRRKALRGAVIVFFTAGYSGKRFIFEKAHELGATFSCQLCDLVGAPAPHDRAVPSVVNRPHCSFAVSTGVRTVIIDGPDSWAKTMVADGIAEKFLPVDMRDPDQVFEKSLEAIKASARRRDCASCSGTIAAARRSVRPQVAWHNSPSTVSLC